MTKRLTKKAQALAKSWEEIKRRHEQWPPFSRRPTPAIVPKTSPVQVIARPAKFVPHGGTAKPIQAYTGDKMIGVAVMHKSCLQPVFSQEQAEDSAKMRRG